MKIKTFKKGKLNIGVVVDDGDEEEIDEDLMEEEDLDGD